jgi:hypothetical protein
MAEPFEYNRPFIAGRIAERGQDGFEDFYRLGRLAGKEQPFAPIAFLEIPPRSFFGGVALLGSLFPFFPHG